MPMPILHAGATVLCMHAGNAVPTAPFPRVTVSGQPVVQTTSPYVIAGCTQASVPAPFCASGQWVTGATRVQVGHLPVAIVGGTAVCLAPGTGMQAVASQTRVLAT
jgi:uncharacterized Zn-binding protein involved in type VI secretion